jgi:hypothetical protein
MNLSFIPSCSEEDRRRALYQGDLVIFPPSASTLALADFARTLVEEAFAPFDPCHVHEFMAVQQVVEILVPLKPHFIHHPTTKTLLQRVLVDHDCPPDLTYQDVPRLRVAFPQDFLTTGIAYAHHPHRDT